MNRDSPQQLVDLAKASRNHGMPLEALRYYLTPLGLHYLLIHFDIPDIAEADWRLLVSGLVDEEMALSLDQLLDMRQASRTVTMECAGNGRVLVQPRPAGQPWTLEAVGTATWTGVPVVDVLGRAGLDVGASEVIFEGHDSGIQNGVDEPYRRGLSIAELSETGALLAYQMNGAPLAPQHGWPVRLVVPGWYGMASVKWLRSMTITDSPFTGIHHETYRYQLTEDDPGTPVERIQVRSLMVPPGRPDNLSRERIVEEGPVMIRGRAWSGNGAITSVEVSVGDVWHQAEVGLQDDANAWVGWSWVWNAEPGAQVLRVRAADESGNTQPIDVEWNVQGMANNAVQRVLVTVVSRSS